MFMISKDSLISALSSLNEDNAISLLATDDLLSGSSKDGMNFTYLYIGMSGQKLVDYMNKNLRDIDSQFIDDYAKLYVRIVSNQIKEMKVDKGIVYYTLDDEEVKDRTWQSLEGAWGKITGNLADQRDLMTILNTKVETDDFDLLTTKVEGNSDNIVLLQSDISKISSSLDSLINTVTGTTGVLYRLDNIETSLSKKITSQEVTEIRCVNGTALEFTLNGTDWHPVSSAGTVEWGDILGDIENQADLNIFIEELKFNMDSITKDMEVISGEMEDLINQMETMNEIVNNVQSSFETVSKNLDTMNEKVEGLDSKTNELSSDLTEHKEADNPHNIDKTKVGLSEVDNTSDENKPVSIAQQQAIDSAIEDLRKDLKDEIDIVTSNIKVVSISKEDYEELENKDNNTYYIINNLDN